MTVSELLRNIFQMGINGPRTSVSFSGGETPEVVAKAPGVSVEVTAFGNLDSLPGQVSVSGEAWQGSSRAQAGLVLHR